MELPAPTDDAANLSRQLQQLISEEISNRGPVSLEQFWQRAMYEPGLGYYSGPQHKFGSAGDFVTAPELGSVFGHCVASFLNQSLPDLAEATILEPGAGSGAMAATLLQSLESMDRLPARYQILEVSAELRQRQRETLGQRCPGLLERVSWLDQPPEDPWSGVLLANEVVDALPARRFVRRDEGWDETRVGLGAEGLQWVATPADQQDAAALDRRAGIPDPGYHTEYQPMMAPWVQALTAGLTRGLVLFCDYGYPRHEYYHPQRDRGTLVAHYRHRAHDDVLRWPGLQDLSVSVDFTALAEACDGAGLEVWGYTTQAQFLLQNGLAEILSGILDLPLEQQMAMHHEIKVLTLPAEMGDRFQWLMAGRGLDPAPLFALDQRGRL